MLQKLKITSSLALVALFLLVTAHQSNASTQSQQSSTLTNFKHDYFPNYTANSIVLEQTGIKLARSWGHYKSKRKHYCERKRRGRYSQSRYCRSYRARHAAKARARYKERKRKRWERFKRSRTSSSSRARTTSNRGGAAAKARIAQLEKDLAASRSKEQAMASAARELTASKARIAQLEKDLAASRSKEQAMANAARELTASKARIAQLEKELAALKAKEQASAQATAAAKAQAESQARATAPAETQVVAIVEAKTGLSLGAQEAAALERLMNRAGDSAVKRCSSELGRSKGYYGTEKYVRNCIKRAAEFALCTAKYDKGTCDANPILRRECVKKNGNC